MFRLIIILFFCLFLAACEDGVDGVTGPSGADGKNAEFELQGISNPNNPTVGHGDDPGMPEHAHLDRSTYNDTVVVHCDEGYEWNAPLYTDCIPVI